jgi:hypothetical protein
MQNITNSILNLFTNQMIVINNVEKLNFSEVSKKTIKYGYVINPALCNSYVLNYFNQKYTINYNATFYKKWEEIINKSRLELYIDQLNHYASTYGTDFTGEVYLPEGSIVLPEISELKVISLITKEEVIVGCLSMLSSGIALHGDTINDIKTILDYFNVVVDIETIKNREAKILFMVANGLVPVSTNPEEMVRFLVYLATGDLMIIKNAAFLTKIKNSNFDISEYIQKFGTVELSTVFNRYKEIFLAFKSANPKNRSIVNNLAKLSKKHHIPKQPTFFENILTDFSKIPFLEKNLENLNNFKKVSLLQSINIRLKEIETKVYVIRNNKAFIESKSTKSNKEYLKIIYDIIYKSLLLSVNKKACKNPETFHYSVSPGC